MKKTNPYKSYQYALASLDNGGRFYNLWSKANDGDITSGELAKAAGVWSGKQNMILYLEMSLLNLEDANRDRVLSHLSEDLKKEYSKFKPARFTPVEAKQHAQLSKAAIITGIPKLIDSKSEFTGFIIVPIIADKTTTFTMIPMIDEYDVYELRDQQTDEDFYIAHSRSRRKLEERVTRCGGIIKELNAEDSKVSDSSAFLEMVYYSY